MKRGLMMADTNPHTGERMISKLRDKKKFDENFDRIFGKKEDKKDKEDGKKSNI